jgi:uncharacterized protein YjbI with pentapeptide repeats
LPNESVVPDLSGADLTRVDLHVADLRDANLSGAKLHVADLTRADLRSATCAAQT